MLLQHLPHLVVLLLSDLVVLKAGQNMNGEAGGMDLMLDEVGPAKIIVILSEDMVFI